MYCAESSHPAVSALSAPRRWQLSRFAQLRATRAARSGQASPELTQATLLSPSQFHSFFRFFSLARRANFLSFVEMERWFFSSKLQEAESNMDVTLKKTGWLDIGQKSHILLKEGKTAFFSVNYVVGQFLECSMTAANFVEGGQKIMPWRIFSKFLFYFLIPNVAEKG